MRISLFASLGEWLVTRFGVPKQIPRPFETVTVALAEEERKIYELKAYNHRFAPGDDGLCSKCGDAEEWPIHWVAKALAAHVALGGIASDFQLPTHRFWKRIVSYDCCGICGRPQDHTIHSGEVLDSSPGRTQQSPTEPQPSPEAKS